MRTPNTIELLGSFGDDLQHALAAWTSTSRELSDEKRARVGALLSRLASDGHHTPFEHSSLQFLITADIATHIHFLKHRIGLSINSESARYRELKNDRYLVPSDWPEALLGDYVAQVESAFAKYHRFVAQLVDSGVSRSRAKESARLVLPYATQITWVATFNFRSFMHFQQLRNSTHAQAEVRALAQDSLRQVRALGTFTASLDAFGWDVQP